MQTPFREAFRKGAIAEESMRFRLQATMTYMHGSPWRARPSKWVTMPKAERVMRQEHYAGLGDRLSKSRESPFKTPEVARVSSRGR